MKSHVVSVFAAACCVVRGWQMLGLAVFSWGNCWHLVHDGSQHTQSRLFLDLFEFICVYFVHILDLFVLL